jgi:hypothetical protein
MSEIERRKRRARELYRQMQAELDTVDCGLSILGSLRPHVRQIVADFDAEIAWLRANDPAFPKSKAMGTE